EGEKLDDGLDGGCGLALRELESAPCAAPAVLLALLHADVTRDEPALTAHVVVARIDLLERARDAEDDRVGLSRRPAAAHVDRDVVGLRGVRRRERRSDALPRLHGAEELVDVAAVHEESARAGLDAHAGDGGLPAAQADGDGGGHARIPPSTPGAWAGGGG